MRKKPLPRRKFSPRVYAEIVWRQGGNCACGCGEPLGSNPRDIQYDHIHPLADGGKDTPDNLQALKAKHHRSKSSREAMARAKARRIQANEGRRKLSRHEKLIAGYLDKEQESNG